MKKYLSETVALLSLALLIVLSGCGKSVPVQEQNIRGGVSGIVSVDQITSKRLPGIKRSAALLGIFVSEYISITPSALAAEGGLKGIDAQMHIALGQNTVQDPDFDLLQAFGDALHVDVQDMLNRSTDRQQALDVYREALNNVANRSNNRFKELSASQEQLKEELRTLSKNRSDADRALKQALRDKEFSDAGEKQKAVNETQAAFAETDLKEKQIDELVTTFDTLLTLYGEKIIAIDSNREILISGTKVVDVPGIEELQIIQKNSTTRSRSRGGSTFDSLFEDKIL